MKFGRAFFLLAISLLILSCGITSMMMTLQRPAKIDLSAYKQIAIGDITDPGGKLSPHARDMADEIASTLFNTGRFEVLDRQHLDQIMIEHQLNLSGLINESTASEVGELIGTAVLVFGRIQNDSYNESQSKGDKWKDKKGKSHQNNFRDGKYDLAVNIKLIDIETSKLIAVENISASDSRRTVADLKTPAKIDRDVLYRNCITKIMSKFSKIVAPYNINVEVSFETDKQLPEVDQAITYLKIGNWDEGLRLLEQATEKPGLKNKVRAKAYFDLGLAQMYGDQNEQAIASFQEALVLNPKSKYEDAIKKSRSEKKKSDELKKQLHDQDK